MNAENITENDFNKDLRRVPFLCVLVPLCLGIGLEFLCPGAVKIPLTIILAVMVFILGCLCKLTDKCFKSVGFTMAAVSCLFFCVGVWITSYRSNKDTKWMIDSYGQNVWVVARVSGAVTEHNGTAKCIADVYPIENKKGDPTFTTADSSYIRCMLTMNDTSSNSLSDGDILIIKGRVVPTSPNTDLNQYRYSRYLYIKGCFGHITVTDYQIVHKSNGFNLEAYASKVQSNLNSLLKKTIF